MNLYAYYIERGHTIQELLNLSETEKLYYKAAMEVINGAVNDNGQ